MALDGGGSTTLAFDGKRAQPAVGRAGASDLDRADALLLRRLRAAAGEAVVSPNGDGVAEEQRLAYKIVRPSTVDRHAHRARRHGRASRRPAHARAGHLRRAVPAVAGRPSGRPCRLRPPAEPAPPAEGRWTLAVTATDDQAQRSTAVRALLGELDARLPRRCSRVRSSCRRRGGTRRSPGRRPGGAASTVTVETTSGVVVRTIAKRRFEAGALRRVERPSAQREARAFGGSTAFASPRANELGHGRARAAAHGPP